jgi:hypothetical protein
MNEERILANFFTNPSVTGKYYIESCCETRNIKVLNARTVNIKWDNGIVKEEKTLDSLTILGVLSHQGGHHERFFQGTGKFQCPHCKKELRHAEITQKEIRKNSHGLPVMNDYCVSNGEWWV